MFRRLDTGEPLDLLPSLFAEGRGTSGRPWVMLNMVESVDGATAVGGSASGLNDEDDRTLFLALRSVADVVMMGAQTVRSENLGPVAMSDEMMDHRRAAGLEGEPTLVILTRSLDIDPEHRVFSDQARRPTILTSVDADPGGVAALSRVADVVQVEVVDGRSIVDALGGASVILCEGGPTVNSQLVNAGVVDEINLTVAPMLAMGQSKRIASGPVLDPPLPLVLDRVWTGERSLFLRYLRG
jgi:riboflavin biosynthesis pyrimidine reductase